jgi:thymidylate synthase
LILDQTSDLHNLGLIEGLPEECLRSLVLKADVNRGNNLLIHTDLNALKPEFIEKYDNVFHWHLRDSMRSLMLEEVKDPKFEFSYYNRLRKYFGLDQVQNMYLQLKTQGYSRPIVTWDPRIDLTTKELIPCLMSISFRTVGQDLAMSVVFRARDIVRRLIPNWNALAAIQKEVASEMKLSMGTLTDFSLSWFYRQDDLERLRKIL